MCVFVCDAHIPVKSIMHHAYHKNVEFNGVAICCYIQWFVDGSL